MTRRGLKHLHILEERRHCVYTVTDSQLLLIAKNTTLYLLHFYKFPVQYITHEP
jgi:hypothetical protein